MVQIRNLSIFMYVDVYSQNNVRHRNSKEKEDNSGVRTIFTLGPVFVHDLHSSLRFSPYVPLFTMVLPKIPTYTSAKTGKSAFKNLGTYFITSTSEMIVLVQVLKET